MGNLQISIDNISLDFTHHLKNNNRILFSGAYGTGKTYFLKKYFEERKGEYNVFHIFPVNYQVSQNEDIFELIKIDILYHILMKGWNLDTQEKENISKTLALQAYTINNSPGIFQNLLKIFTFGKSDTIVKPLNELEEISNKFSKYYDEINK